MIRAERSAPVRVHERSGRQRRQCGLDVRVVEDQHVDPLEHIVEAGAHGFGGDHQTRCGVGDHVLQPVGGIGRVEGQVGASGGEDGDDRVDHGAGPGKRETDPVVGSHAAIDE